MLKVLIVENSAFMRLLISDLVSKDSSIEAVGKASNGRDAKKKVLKLKPDVVILVLNMGKYGGIYAVRKIMKKRPTSILILSFARNIDLQPVFEALKRGAVNYMNKLNRNKFKIWEMSVERVQKVKSVSRCSNQKKMGNYLVEAF